MRADDPIYGLRLAAGADDLAGAQRLRYQVFVQEMGGDGPLVDHVARLERDEFDPLFDHLLLIDEGVDPATHDHVVGAYRLLPSDRVGSGRFYSEAEYDLTVLRTGGRKLLELGRSCVHPDHRGGTAMFHLWNGLADYVLERGIEVLFGVASFHGKEAGRYAQALSWLHYYHLAPPSLRVVARAEQRQEMALSRPEELDRL
ncbi:MAG: GNAT family N-acetyltransferase, partial [Paracoccaceae bacterium]